MAVRMRDAILRAAFSARRGPRSESKRVAFSRFSRYLIYKIAIVRVNDNRGNRIKCWTIVEKYQLSSAVIPCAVNMHFSCDRSDKTWTWMTVDLRVVIYDEVI